MTSTTTAGTYLLSAEHRAALERLSSDSGFDAVVDSPVPDFILQLVAARQAGTGYGLAIIDRGELVGACTLRDVGRTEGPVVAVWIASPERGKGYATFGVRMAAEFAFRNLGLARIRALPGESGAAKRVLEKNGFAAVDGSVFMVTRDGWTEFRDGPALARLHPDLKAILEAELAAGNEVLETGGGWPDPDSVFVRLRNPFAVRPSPLPDGVTYTEPNDPHWWKADYTTRSPRHVLAC